jgi:hypothetical protein
VVRSPILQMLIYSLARPDGKVPAGNETKRHPQASNEASVEQFRCVPLSNTMCRPPDLNATQEGQRGHPVPISAGTNTMKLR